MQDAVASARASYSAVGRAHPELVHDFEWKYEAWRRTWYQGTKADSSSAAARAHGVEYDTVLALGPKITPLVVLKLTQPSEVFAIELYKELDAGFVPDQGKAVPSTPGEEAAAILVRSRDRHEQAKGILESLSQEADPSATEAWRAMLCRLGPCVVADVMLTYGEDRATDSWATLLHSLVHGTDAHGGRRLRGAKGGGGGYEQWRTWFDEGEHQDAPLLV